MSSIYRWNLPCCQAVSNCYYNLTQIQNSGFTPWCAGKLAFWKNKMPWPAMFTAFSGVNTCSIVDWNVLSLKMKFQREKKCTLLSSQKPAHQWFYLFSFLLLPLACLFNTHTTHTHTHTHTHTLIALQFFLHPSLLFHHPGTYPNHLTISHQGMCNLLLMASLTKDSLPVNLHNH